MKQGAIIFEKNYPVSCGTLKAKWERGDRLRKINHILPIIILLALFCIIGCGNSEENVMLDSSVQSEDKADKESAEIASKNQTNINVSLGKVGNQLSLPEAYPKDEILLLDDANIINVNDTGTNKSISIVFKTGKSMDEAIGFYKDLFAKGTINMQAEVDNGYLIDATTSNYEAVVIFSLTNEKENSIMINVVPKE